MQYEKLKTQLKDMNSDELRQLIMDMRTRRRTPAAKPASKKAAAKKPLDLTKLSKDELENLLGMLEA